MTEPSTNGGTGPSVSVEHREGVPVLLVEKVAFHGRVAERLVRRVQTALSARTDRSWRIPLSPNEAATLHRLAAGSWTLTADAGSVIVLPDEVDAFGAAVFSAYYEHVLPWLTGTGRKPKFRCRSASETEVRVQMVHRDDDPSPPRGGGPSPGSKTGGTPPTGFEPARGVRLPGKTVAMLRSPDDGERVAACVVEWRGRRFLHLQRWWEDTDLRHRPGKGVVTVKARDIPRFAAALSRAMSKGRARVSAGRSRSSGDYIDILIEDGIGIVRRHGVEVRVVSTELEELATRCAVGFRSLARAQHHDVTDEVTATGTDGDGTVTATRMCAQTHPGTMIRGSVRSPSDSGGAPKKRRSAGEVTQFSLGLTGGALPPGKEQKPRKRSPSQTVVLEFYAGVRKRLGNAAPKPHFSRDVGLARKALDAIAASAQRTLKCSQAEAREKAMERMRLLFEHAWEDRWFAGLDAPHFGCFYSIHDRLNAEIVVGRNRAREEFYAGFAAHPESIEPKTIYTWFRDHFGHEHALREVRRVHGDEIAAGFRR